MIIWAGIPKARTLHAVEGRWLKRMLEEEIGAAVYTYRLV
jgi:hypothetical protein